jgi:hypothetical protein
MKTGETVEERGLYLNDCCNKEQIFEEGDSFTRCLKCMSLCVWDLESELVTCDELDNIGAIAA